MPVIQLTAVFVRTAACPQGSAKIGYFDAQQRGLLLEVRSSGRRTWFQRYTDETGRTRTFKLGTAEILGLAEARLLGQKLVREVVLGVNPQGERNARRHAPDLSTFVKERFLPHVRAHRQSWRDVVGICSHHILPVFGAIRVNDLATAQVTEMLLKMQSDGYANGTINKVRSVLHSIYKLGRKWKVQGFPSENPVVDVASRPTADRQRCLSDEETRRLVHAIKADGEHAASRALMMLLLTGARKREITHAMWSSVDLERGLLLVARSKSGKSRNIVLSRMALELLKGTPRIPGNPYIFPSRITGRPSPTLYPQWQRIRSRAGLSDLRIHDLRHSFASYLVNRGVSLYVVQDLLGHSTPKMTQRYSHLSPNTLQDAAGVAASVISNAVA